MNQVRNDIDWERWRGELSLDADEIYLNAGSYSPTPRRVQEAALFWRTRLASSPMRTLIETMPKQLNSARQALAQYIDGDAQNLLMLPNATHAVNVVVHSLNLPAESVVLMTDHEYGAMRFAWEREAKKQGYEVDIATLPLQIVHDDQIVESIKNRFRSRTKVLFFSHVTSPTGLVLPAAKLCRAAAEHGIITVIDGAHAPGMIPLSMQEVGADFYAGNCHKWMMAPIGAGFLHVADRFQSMISPLVTSWGWEFPIEAIHVDSGWGGSQWSQRVEFQGTTDRTPQLVIPDAIEFRHQIGDSAVYERTKQLRAHARETFTAAGLVPFLPETLTGMMTAFEIPSVDPVKAREWIWNTHRISVPFTRTAGKSFLRISTAWFNHFGEIEQLASVIPEIPYGELR
ncbi:aminotransferase class V-fold PLP-dependent enzyme [bacterium]|nr:aminotransferase class V-fold PLP-dependent enzyme [bacterium]